MKSNRAIYTVIIGLLAASAFPAGAQQVQVKTDAVESNEVAYLGVGTEPVDSISAKQLKITKGTGLVVMHVDKKSAADDVLEEYDILLKLDDQILCNQPQLAALVQSKKPGDEVAMEVMREGKRQTIKVALGKRRQVAARMQMQGHWPSIDLHSPRMHTLFMGPDGPMDVSSVEEALQDLLSKSDRFSGNITNILKTTIEVDASDTGGTSHSMSFGSSAITVTMIDSDVGASATLSESDGKRTLTMKSLDGKVIYEGPVADKTREELPEEYRDLFDRLKKMRAKTDVKTGTHFQSSVPSGVSM